MNYLIKFIRYALFIPLAIVFTVFIYAGLLLLNQCILALVVWIYNNIGAFWTIVIMIVIGFTVVYSFFGLFNFLCAGILLLLKKISPSLSFAFYTFLILILLSTIFDIYCIWTAADSWTVFLIFISIIFTFIVIGFSWMMIQAAGIIPDDI